ncbi:MULTISPECIES: histidine phosphatase family protein [Bradyrhizobium]|uniref:Phosphohistidine phosphatase SixA n=1 Tax=Bradyrhizobium ottawaense TaxID=931866 RepID=A0ABV4FQ57_9BRAD|nr:MULTISPECIES: histidine phosphatase family protein [Bradyrhizobium]MBR1288596.1 histidine phosphatase family protein [Bradyrhizobium ottawaense]MDA9417225.1 fructose-2,6-bisphosphatase [Bradyrhizobium sp. CCBAU 25360]MDA9484208.1 fructose-2,6-bisphosphatase [Bradyrhizobium sp. CCBAU 11445]PDT71030.1 histidine phosphatase family protein [Bradyrhizobium ottawaense]WLB46328.1 histidine phosphatase family protein [Bradyrhizobium ottawaense]
MNVLCRLVLIVLLAGFSRHAAADTPELIAALKQGGYVLIFRHTATDDSQKDVYPFKFDDMSAQRQLSEKGRDMALQIGAAVKDLAIPIGDVYTSRLNRAIEAGKLISGREVKPVDALTDSSNASASGMANPTGANAKAGQAVRQLVDAPPKAGSNNFLVTHKTNIADAFGKEAGDVGEGEAFVYKAGSSGPATFAGRLKPADWSAKAGK